jgi:preprotein translocase subunit SecG
MQLYDIYKLISLIAIFLAVIVSVFVIIVVIIQPSNSDGIGAISGHSETFYGKNKSKTLESKLKKLTVVSISILAVCMIVFTVFYQLMSNLG